LQVNAAVLVFIVSNQDVLDAVFVGTARCSSGASDELSNLDGVHETSLRVLVNIVPLREYFNSAWNQAFLLWVDERGLDDFLLNLLLRGGQDITVLQLELLESHAVLVSADDFVIWQLQLDVFGGEIQHLSNLALELPHGRRGVKLDNDGTSELSRAIVADLALDHVANDDSVEHLTLKDRVVRLHVTRALLLTDLDDSLEDLDEATDALGLVLTR